MASNTETSGRPRRQRNRNRGNGAGTLFKRGSKGGPWFFAYHDERGRRLYRSSGTTDKATAGTILNKLLADVAKRREGVVNAADARAIDANRRPLNDHVDEYLADCARSGQAVDHVANKRTLLTRFVADANVARLSDLSPDALARHLRTVASAGRSARTQNAARAAAVAFVNWCVAQGRTSTNPLKAVA